MFALRRIFEIVSRKGGNFVLETTLKNIWKSWCLYWLKKFVKKIVDANDDDQNMSVAYFLIGEGNSSKSFLFLLYLSIFLETVNFYMHIVFSHAVVSSLFVDYCNLSGFSVESIKLLVGMMAFIKLA